MLFKLNRGLLMLAVLGSSLSVQAAEVAAGTLHDGFNLLLSRPQDQPVLSHHAFKGLYDFNGPVKAGDEEAPWLGLDITDERQALELALRMQRYVYEGWFENEDSEKTDTHFTSNSYRTWCSTPWLNTNLESGREAVHGLTKEFPLHPGAIESYYPGISVEKYQKTSWGTAFFNRPNCEMYHSIFGSPASPRDPLQNVESVNLLADGAVSFKLLFSTVRSEEYLPFVHAYEWNAHVSAKSTPPNAPAKARSLDKVTHIQMDIAIKDARIKGLRRGQRAKTDSDVIPWIMLTYYFDPGFKNSDLEKLRDIKNLPAALKAMRPLGVQYGLDRGQSVIFKGARNNHDVNDADHSYQFDESELIEKMGDRLNGPADNPKSSCLGCHALAMPHNVKIMIGEQKLAVSPGVLSNFTYNTFVKSEKETGLLRFTYNFNHQVAIAIENYLAWIKPREK